VNRETDSVRPQATTSGRIADYRLGHLIGRGGMAAVYLAQDERSDRTVALKVLAPELARDDAFRTRFLRESRAAAAVANPHILPVYDVGEAGGSLYLAMRYVRGGDVRSLLNRLGPLPVAWAWNTVAQVASALDAAHAHGLVHRDVKPGNLLLDAGPAANGSGAESSDLEHVYLSDFGIRKDPPPGGMIAMGKFVGNLDYVAPEQIEGRALDGRADLYALACVGFELLCGSPPFGQDPGLTVMYAQLYAPPPSATVRRPDLPAPVDQVLATALAKNPGDRYATCTQFADELRAALGLRPDEPVTPAPLRSPGDGEPPAEAAPAPARPAPAPPAIAWPALARPPAAGPRDPEPQTVRLAGPAPAPPAPGWSGTQDGPPPAGPGPVGEAEGGLTGHYPDQPRRMSGGMRLVLAAAAAVVIAAAVVVGLALTSGGSAPAARPQASSPASSPPPSPSAATVAARQAAAVNQLLGTSGATRKSLQGAVSDAGHCTNLPSAVSRIQSVVNQRDTEYHRALKLTTAALPHGTAVKSNLTAALRGSLTADRAYLTWAKQQLANGCVPTSQSSAYSAATAAGAQADAAKQAFVQVWNPVAARYGVPRTSAISI
jgi:tRNA A-37 threonylcarbamoyl transferase component Bud32